LTLRRAAIRIPWLCAAWLPFWVATALAGERAARTFDIGPQPLAAALAEFARQSRQQVLFAPGVMTGKQTSGVRGLLEPLLALEQLLAHTGVAFSITPGGAILIGAPLAESESPAAPVRTPVGQAEEVIVTARKREEPLFDVPVAVSVFTRDALVRRGANNLADFLQDAPGVSIYDNGGSYKVTIRGISTSLGSNENGYYLDDLPFTGITVPINPDVRAWDLERVEVLRGPQGTLFGEGSIGGTIRVITREAVFNEWQAGGSVSASSTDRGGDNSGVKGMVNIPLLDDRLALRAAGTRERYDGWIDETGGRGRLNSQAIGTSRVKLRWQASQRLSMQASYWHYDGSFPSDNRATQRGEISAAEVFGFDSRYDLTGISGRYAFDTAELFYSFAHNAFMRRQSGLLLGAPLTVADIDIDVRSHELRLSSTAAGPWQWTVGLYRRDADRDDRFTFDLFDLDNRSAIEACSEAAFAEVTYALPALPFELTAGLRYVRERIGGFEVNHDLEYLYQDAVYTSFNPRAIVAWRPDESWRVYLSAAKGYRSGQLQPLVSSVLAGPLGMELPRALRDDSIWSYEIGAKAQLWDGHLEFEGALYHSDWRNVAVRLPLGSTGFNGLANSAGTSTNGVEASLSWRPVPDWTVQLGASYADAQYAGSVPGTGIVKGKPVDDVAKTTASLSVQYSRTLLRDVEGSARLGVQYNSPRDYPSFGPPQFVPGDAITAVGARFGIANPHWGVYLFVDNLTDTRAAASPRSANLLGIGDPEFTAVRLRPRTIGIEIRSSFE